MMSRFISRSVLRADMVLQRSFGCSARLDDVDDEDQGGAARDVRRLAALTVTEVGRDHEHDAAALLDPHEALDPAVDQLTLGQGEGGGLAALEGGVEGVVATAPDRTEVVHRDLGALLDRRAVALL